MERTEINLNAVVLKCVTSLRREPASTPVFQKPISESVNQPWDDSKRFTDYQICQKKRSAAEVRDDLTDSRRKQDEDRVLSFSLVLSDLDGWLLHSCAHLMWVWLILRIHRWEMCNYPGWKKAISMIRLNTMSTNLHNAHQICRAKCLHFRTVSLLALTKTNLCSQRHRIAIIIWSCRGKMY